LRLRAAGGRSMSVCLTACPATALQQFRAIQFLAIQGSESVTKRVMAAGTDGSRHCLAHAAQTIPSAQHCLAAKQHASTALALCVQVQAHAEHGHHMRAKPQCMQWHEATLR
jgi:hypothetical protein